MAAKKTSPATPPAGTVRYALGMAGTNLGAGGDDVTEVEENGTRRLSFRGTPYATYRIEGADLVVTVKKPASPGDLTARLHRYKELPDGWLEWRTPVSRDPKPWLEADVGTMAGRVQFEMAQGAK